MHEAKEVPLRDFFLDKLKNNRRTLLSFYSTMENTENKFDSILEAIGKVTSGVFEKKENGVDLLAIVKKVNRNRKKGESLE